MLNASIGLQISYTSLLRKHQSCHVVERPWLDLRLMVTQMCLFLYNILAFGTSVLVNCSFKLVDKLSVLLIVGQLLLFIYNDLTSHCTCFILCSVYQLSSAFSFMFSYHDLSFFLFNFYGPQTFGKQNPHVTPHACQSSSQGLFFIMIWTKIHLQQQNRWIKPSFNKLLKCIAANLFVKVRNP